MRWVCFGHLCLQQVVYFDIVFWKAAIFRQVCEVTPPTPLPRYLGSTVTISGGLCTTFHAIVWRNLRIPRLTGAAISLIRRLDVSLLGLVKEIECVVSWVIRSWPFHFLIRVDRQVSLFTYHRRHRIFLEFFYAIEHAFFVSGVCTASNATSQLIESDISGKIHKTAIVSWLRQCLLHHSKGSTIVSRTYWLSRRSHGLHLN